MGRTLLLAWDVSAVQGEPWRRLLQELSYARREEEYMESRRRLGVSAESVWLVPTPSGGGVAVVYLEALDPERALGELAASERLSTHGTAEQCASFSASIWRGYHGQGAVRFCSPGEMIVVQASVRLRKTHDLMAHFAKDGISLPCTSPRLEQLLTTLSLRPLSRL